MKSVIRTVGTIASTLLIISGVACSCDSETKRLDPLFAIGGDVEEVEGGSWVLDFGSMAVGGVAGSEVTIRNEGTAALRIWVEEEAEPPFSAALGSDSMTVPPSGEVDPEFRFAPTATGTFEQTLVISTNEGKGASYRIRLVAEAVEAVLDCDPASLDFGTLARGSEHKLEATCVNPLAVPLQVTLGAAVGNGAHYFFGDLPEGERGTTIEVGAGQSFVAEVNFRAERVGSYTVSLPFFDETGETIAAIAATAEVIEGALQLEPTGCLDFGRVQLGAAEERTLRMTNLSTSEVAIEAGQMLGDSDAFALLSPSLGDVVIPPGGGSVDFVFRYAPETPIEHGAILRLHTSDPQQPELDICLSGASGTAMIACSPASLDFGDVALGTEATLRFLCGNVAEEDDDYEIEPLYVGAVEVDHEAFRVELVNTDGSPGASAEGYRAGESFWLYVSHAPQEEGFADATVVVESSAIGSERIELGVSGKGRELPPCQFAIQPPRLGLGLVSLGSQRQASFHIANTAGHACLIHGLRLSDGSDPAFQISPLSQAEIPPFGRLEVPVVFAPQEEGRVEGQVEFYVSNPDAEAPQRVELSGMGGERCLDIEPERLDFGSLAPGCNSREQVVSIINTCTEAFELEAIRVDADAYPWFTLSDLPETPLLMEPMRRIEFGVSYQPDDEADHRGILELLFTDSEPYTIEMEGRGADQAVQTDVFQQRAAKVDVLWVIDNSLSFLNHQNLLANKLPTFLEFALEQEVDFHLGVTTTGLTPFGVGLCHGGADGGEAGRLFPIDGSSPRILSSSMDPDELREAWEYNVRVGTCHAVEYHLEPAALALTPPLVNHASSPDTVNHNDGNLGFLRSDAALSIIVVSEAGWSGNGARTVPEYVELFRSLKPSTWADAVKIHMITHGAEKGPCVPYISCRNCYDAAQATGGLWLDVCTPLEDDAAWEAGFREMSRSAFGFEDTFRLRSGAGDLNGDDRIDDEDIEVRVNGVLLPSKTETEEVAWRYDPELNAVVFSPSHRPRPGDEIHITYEVACL